MWMNLFWAFLIGGLICGVVQLAMDLTPFSFSNSHVLVAVVLLGEILGFFGLYQPLIDLSGMGAAVPLCGFGNTLITGVFESIAENGLLGIFLGAFTAGAAGLAAAVFFGFVVGLIFRPKG